MLAEYYLRSKIICGKLVNIGMDDYFDTVFFEYEDNGKLVEVRCDSTVPDYEAFIADYITHSGALEK